MNGKRLRARQALAAVAITSAAAVALGACLIADPGPNLPAVPSVPPAIDHLSVEPPTGMILTTLPINFTVPVTPPTPVDLYEWRIFIDYDEVMGSTAYNTSQGQISDAVVSTQVTTVAGAGCHVIEFIVADSFDSDLGGHTPAPPGGDSVTWFYSPGGDLAGCPAYSGALDGSFPDTGSDAGEAGAE